MNNLVILNKGNAVTTSLMISEGVGNDHATVIKLIRHNIADLKELGPVGFEIRKGEPLPQGGFTRSTEYAVLNEQQSTLLITYMRNNDVVRKFKLALVKAFFELAKQKQQPQLIDFDDVQQIAGLLAQSLGKVQEQQEVIEVQTQKIAIDAPKVNFHDQVTAAPDAISLAEAAKIIGTGRNRLISFMRQVGWITRSNEPYQYHGLKQSITALVTGKGLPKLKKMWEESHPHAA